MTISRRTLLIAIGTPVFVLFGLPLLVFMMLLALELLTGTNPDNGQQPRETPAKTSPPVTELLGRNLTCLGESVDTLVEITAATPPHTRFEMTSGKSGSREARHYSRGTYVISDNVLRFDIHESGLEFDRLSAEAQKAEHIRMRHGDCQPLNVKNSIYCVSSRSSSESGFLIEVKNATPQDLTISYKFFDKYLRDLRGRENRPGDRLICRDMAAERQSTANRGDEITEKSCIRELSEEINPNSDIRDELQSYVIRRCRQPEAAVCTHRKINDFRASVPDEAPVSVAMIEEWEQECGMPSN